MQHVWRKVTKEARNLADETLTALAAWLNKIGRPAKTLEVLPRARAIQRQDLFLQYVNALVALQRWSEIKDLLLSEHSVADPSGAAHVPRRRTGPSGLENWRESMSGNALCRLPIPLKNC